MEVGRDWWRFQIVKLRNCQTADYCRCASMSREQESEQCVASQTAAFSLGTGFLLQIFCCAAAIARLLSQDILLIRHDFILQQLTLIVKDIKQAKLKDI